jgi:hypothetical protein
MSLTRDLRTERGVHEESRNPVALALLTQTVRYQAMTRDGDCSPKRVAPIAFFDGGAKDPKRTVASAKERHLRRRRAKAEHDLNRYFPSSRKLSMKDLISGSFKGLISSFESPATS